MTIEEAIEVYQEGQGKRGPKSKEYNKAKLMLIEAGHLKQDGSDPTKEEKKEKKPPMPMTLKDPQRITERDKVELYKKGLEYITDKRNFSFDYYLIGNTGCTRREIAEWESNNPQLERLRVVATNFIEAKAVDSVCDKYSGGNPLGVMLLLKSVYGYDDRGSSSQITMDGDIVVDAVIEDEEGEEIAGYELPEYEE